MRRPLLGLVAMGVVIALSGCGGTVRQRVAVEPTADFVAGAAQRTSATSSAHFEMTMTTTEAGHEVHLGGTGGYDQAANRFTMELDLGSLAGQLSGAAGELSSMIGDGKMELRVIDGVAYLRLPFLSALAGGSTEWVSVDVNALGGTNPFAVGSADPSAFLEYLRSAGGTVEDKGHEQVRGVDTTHLSAQVTLRTALDGLTAGQRSKLQQWIDRLGTSDAALLATAMPVDVYIDGAGLVRRLAIAFDGAPKGISVALQVDFFDFGSPVEVDVPPADSVTSMTGALRGLLGGSTSS